MINHIFNKKWVLYGVISEAHTLVDINGYPFDNEYNYYCKKSIIIPIAEDKLNNKNRKIITKDGILYE